jgi:Cu-processing system permease protein
MATRTIWAIAQKELRDALRNRWFLLFAAVFTVLALAFSYLSLAGAGVVGFAGFGRTTASLINLVLLIVPLMALTVGAQSLSAERERGTLAYLLAHPVGRVEVFVGKYLGLALSLLGALALGFGISGAVMAASGGGATDPGVWVRLVALAFLLSLTMLSVGFLISALTGQASVAVGVGLLVWLAFVFLGDLGMMGTAIALKLPVDGLFWLSLTNPLQVFKMAAILNIQSTMDILGPAGIYAAGRYGDALPGMFLVVLAAWAVVPAVLAYGRFSATGDL